LRLQLDHRGNKFLRDGGVGTDTALRQNPQIHNVHRSVYCHVSVHSY